MLLSSQIASSAQIAPTAIIGEDVEIGENTIISDYVIIRDGVKIGANCKISPQVVIGEDAQDKGFKGEKSYIVIGDNNIIREFVTIHKPIGEGETTVVGNDNFIMAYCHLAHNTKIGNHNTLANGTSLAGHVVVEDFVTFGGGAGVHQNCRIGSYAMLSGMSATNHDALPYMIFGGIPSVALTTNRIALKRANIDQAVRSELMRAFKLIYNEKSSVPKIIERLEGELNQVSEIQYLIEFIKNSKRGIILQKYAGENYGV